MEVLEEEELAEMSRQEKNYRKMAEVHQ